jgi:hypothetical protein
MMCGEYGPVNSEGATPQIAGRSMFPTCDLLFMRSNASFQVPGTVHYRELELLQFRTAWKELNYMGFFGGRPRLLNVCEQKGTCRKRQLWT